MPDALHVEPHYASQLVHLAVLHELVGQPQPCDARRVAVVAHPLCDGRAQPSVAHAVLNGDDLLELLPHFVQDVLVEGFQEAHVVVGDGNSPQSPRGRSPPYGPRGGFYSFAGCMEGRVYSSPLGGRRGGLRGYQFLHVIADGPYGEYGHIGAVVQPSSGAHLHSFEGAAPVVEHAAAARIAYDEGTHVLLLSGEHQSAQLVLVHGRGDGEVGYGPQCRQVEGSVVCGPVAAHQSGAVQTEHHVQAQDGHVVNDVVVGALRKGAVYVAEGQQPLLGHAGREGDGVSLGDAHVEGSLGHLLHHDVHRAASGHGGCHAHDAGVLPRQLEQRLAEHLLVLHLLTASVVALQQLARLGVELSRCVPHGGVVLAGCKAVALLRVQVQQLRPFHVLQLAQYAHQLLHVVAVEGSEVAYVHAVEDVLLVRDGALQRVAQAYEALSAVVLQHSVALHEASGLEAHLVVGLVGAQAQQVLLHAAHRAVYRHVVVVQYDEHVVRARRHVVQSLEGQSAAHGAVADDGHHLALPFWCRGPVGPYHLRMCIGHGHAQCCRDAVRGMPADEGVVLALFG